MLAVCPLTTAATKSDTLISTRARSPGSAGMGRPSSHSVIEQHPSQLVLTASHHRWTQLRTQTFGPRAVHGPVAWRINIYGVGERRGLTACRLAGSCVTAAAGSVAPPPPSTPIGGWCRWCSGAKARTFKPVECSTLHRVCITFSVGCRHQNYPASRAVVATNRQLRSRAAGGFCLPASRS